MSKDIYRPWRANEDGDDLLADNVSAQWRQLLDDSKRCVSELRRSTQLAEQRLLVNENHERVLRRLDAFEQRLGVLERRIAALAGPTLHKHAA
jgi:heme oxygenase